MSDNSQKLTDYLNMPMTSTLLAPTHSDVELADEFENVRRIFLRHLYRMSQSAVAVLKYIYVFSSALKCL